MSVQLPCLAARRISPILDSLAGIEPVIAIHSREYSRPLGQQRPGCSAEVRKQRVDAEAERLTSLGAGGSDHHAMGIARSGGNEFDIN